MGARIPLRLWMVHGLATDFVEAGFVECFSESLFRKLQKAAFEGDADRCPDVWLDLDEWEATVLAGACQNCKTADLPRGQRDRLAPWLDRWEEYCAATLGVEGEAARNIEKALFAGDGY